MRTMRPLVSGWWSPPSPSPATRDAPPTLSNRAARASLVAQLKSDLRPRV